MPETEVIPTPRSHYWDRPAMRWILFGIVAMVYLIGRSPYVGFNDGLSFLLEAETPGFSPYTNATSHFLYNNVQHILVSIFFFLPSVFVLTIFSITCSLLTLGRLYQIVRLFGTPPITWLIPPLMLAFSFTFWQQSEIIEVYAFNNLLFVSYLYFALKDLLRHQARYAPLVGFLLGLALLTHIQHILALPFFIYYLIHSFRHHRANTGLSLAVMLGLFSILFLIPLFGDTNSFSAIFFDNQFKDDVLGINGEVILQGMKKAVQFLMYNFHMFLPLILAGWVICFRDRRRLFWQLLLLFVPFFGFAVKYSVQDNHVFFLISYIVFLVPTGFALMALALRLMPYMSIMFPMMVMMGPMLYMMVWKYAERQDLFPEYAVNKAYKGGVEHLLWPMQNNAKDPLALAKEHYQYDPAAYDRGEIEWNYPAAIALLKYRGELSEK